MSCPELAAPDGMYDAVVIGSGFGGAMAARVLVRAGWSVLMLERGDWVERTAESWSADGVGPRPASPDEGAGHGEPGEREGGYEQRRPP